MKPFKSGSTLAVWLLRILILWMAYLYYFDVFKTFQFGVVNFWFAAAYVIFSVLLFTGGFVNKHTLTVISGLFLFLIPICRLIISGIPGDPVNSLFVYFIPLAVGFYFLTRGNSD
jgi:hypothetical protein